MAREDVLGTKRPFLHQKKKRPKGQKAFSRNLIFLQLLATFQKKEQKKRKKYGQKRRFLLKKGHFGLQKMTKRAKIVFSLKLIFYNV